MHVLVTGGTGVVGRAAVDCLLERGHTARLLSRHADEASGRWSARVEPHPGSIADAAAVQGAADGCDAVLHIAGIVAEEPPEQTFAAVNVGGTRRLLAEARRAGTERFVYVSSLGAERGGSEYHRSKREAEALVREFEDEWLICRPGNVYGPGDQVISMLLKMVRALPAVPVIGGADQPVQPVWAGDLGEALARAVERRDLSREVLELAGRERTTPGEVLDLLEEVTGKDPVRVPVPEWVAERGSDRRLAQGAVLTLEIPLRGHIQVRVEEVVDRVATAVTLHGHPLSGVIRFMVEELGDGRLRFEVRSYTRASNRLDEVAMATVGRPLQRATWESVVEEVVRRSGGDLKGGVKMTDQILDDAAAQRVEEWLDGLVQRSTAG